MGNWNSAAQGAAGGAAIGSVIPGVGTGLGALAGGLYGYFGSDGEDEEKKKYQQELAALAGPQQVNLSPYAQSANSGQFIGDQQQAINMALLQAQGRGPSFAEISARNAMNQSAAQQAALASAAAGRGVSAGAAYRNASNMMGGQQQQAIGQLQALRAQEQLQALAQYGGFAGQYQGQANQLAMHNSQQANAFAIERARLEHEERIRQLRAFEAASGIQTKTGPSSGEQLLAAGGTALPYMLKTGAGAQEQQGRRDPVTGGYRIPGY